MKRYHQLILIITSIVSVSLLLIYRHEYNRLRNVLEVFNFFGQPSECNLPELLNNKTASPQHNWGPSPHFTQVDNAYVYSAFLKNENEAIALIVHEETTTVLTQCYFWFETHPVVSGALNYGKITKLGEDNGLNLYKYNCRLDSVTEEPYAISFSNGKKPMKNLKKIMLRSVQKNKTNLNTICIPPSNTNIYTKSIIFEFLSFHSIVGIDSFIIYNNNVPYKLIHGLENLNTKLGIEIVHFEWNDPFATTIDHRKVIEQDCLLRTNSKSRNIFILDWNEFLVPKLHRSISTLLSNYDATDRIHLFRLQTRTFCTDHEVKYPMILNAIYYDESKPNVFLNIHRNNPIENDVTNTQDITMEIAAIHRYVSCTMHPGHSKKDTTMLKFTSDLRKSLLLKLLKFNRL